MTTNQHLLDYSMERSYLNHISEREDFADLPYVTGRITWLKVVRLPVHPGNIREYDLLSRWQSVLSSMHTWGHRLLFLLNRSGGGNEPVFRHCLIGPQPECGRCGGTDERGSIGQYAGDGAVCHESGRGI